MQGVIYAGIGAGLVLIVILGYLVSCCCCSSKRRTSDETQSLLIASTPPKKYNRGRIIALVLLSFVFLIMAAATFKPIRSFDSGYNRGLDGVENVRNSFQTVKKMMENCTTLLLNIQSVSDETARQVSGDLKDSLEQLSSNIYNARGSIEDVKNIAHQLSKDVDTAVQKGRGYSDRYAKGIAYSYASIMCFSIIILLLTMIPKYLCSRVYKCCGVPTNVLFLCVLWIATSVLLMLGIFFADYCMEPNGNTLKNFQSAHVGDAKVSQSVEYYLSCNPAKPHQNVTGIARDLKDIVSEVNSKVVNVYLDVNEQVQKADLNPEIKKQFGALGQSVKLVKATLDHAADLANCASIREPWDNFMVRTISYSRMMLVAINFVPFRFLFAKILSATVL